MMRETLKKVIFRAGYNFRIGKLYMAVSPGTKILSFHNVHSCDRVNNEFVYGVDTTVTYFKALLDLIRTEWEILPPESIYKMKDAGFVLSFDDGMSNAYTTVAPILRERGIRAIFAICSKTASEEIPHLWDDHLYLVCRELVGNDVFLPMNKYTVPVRIEASNLNDVYRDLRNWIIFECPAEVYGIIETICLKNQIRYRGYEGEEGRFKAMTWEMIEKLSSEGHIIASHTHSHRILARLTRTDQAYELRTSKELLEGKIRKPVEVVVYPFGGCNEVNEQVLQTAKDCGYKIGLLNIPNWLLGKGNLLAIPRIGLPFTDNRYYLHAYLSGWKFWLDNLR